MLWGRGRIWPQVWSHWCDGTSVVVGVDRVAFCGHSDGGGGGCYCSLGMHQSGGLVVGVGIAVT